MVNVYKPSSFTVFSQLRESSLYKLSTAYSFPVFSHQYMICLNLSSSVSLRGMRWPGHAEKSHITLQMKLPCCSSSHLEQCPRTSVCALHVQKTVSAWLKNSTLLAGLYITSDNLVLRVYSTKLNWKSRQIIHTLCTVYSWLLEFVFPLCVKQLQILLVINNTK